MKLFINFVNLNVQPWHHSLVTGRNWRTYVTIEARYFETTNWTLTLSSHISLPVNKPEWIAGHHMHVTGLYRNSLTWYPLENVDICILYSNVDNDLNASSMYISDSKDCQYQCMIHYHICIFPHLKLTIEATENGSRILQMFVSMVSCIITLRSVFVQSIKHTLYFYINLSLK